MYQPKGLLVDAELFRRLESVANPAGADGIADLRQALSWSLASLSTGYAPAAGVGGLTATGSTIIWSAASSMWLTSSRFAL